MNGKKIETVSDSVLTGALAVSLVLMSLGDLRNVVTPVGYWTLWGGWAVLATLLLKPWREASLARPPWQVLLSFGVLFAGMLLAGLVNHDSVTIYHAVKVAVICGLFAVMWLLATRLSWSQMLTALYFSIIVSLLCFFVPLLSGGYMESADGRQGSLFALFGVMWKAGTFFLPLFVAELIVRPHAQTKSSLAIGACLFLVLIDGSRTGLLLVIAILGFSSGMIWWRKDYSKLLRRPQWVLITACCLGGLLLANTGIKAWEGPGVSGEAQVAAPAQLASIAERALTPIVNTRLGSGDEARVQLLLNGIERGAKCLPLGCGFGSTGTEVGAAHPTYVHNAYLAALADFGFLGLAGMLGFLLSSLAPLLLIYPKKASPEDAYYIAALAGSATAYSVALMLHTFTTEMSEWGYLIFALAFAWSLSKQRDGPKTI